MSAITVEKRKKGKGACNTLLERIEESEKNGQYKLDISHLSLSELPAVEISVVPRISVFLAFGNQFYQLPPLTHFRNLKTLDISRNCIRNLDDMRLSQLHHLSHLDISRNELSELPLDMFKLPVLETFLCHRNKITDIPSEISHVKSLTLIDASFNHIQYIGTRVETLPRLEFLNLDNNTPVPSAESGEGAEATGEADSATGNPLMVGIGTRTRRLLERHSLLISKNERRSLIQRALGVRSNVLRREEEAIVAEQLKQTYSREGTLVNEFP